tara:strand:+ start:55 stop:771 length:717 start_codon:yes stop_codon:yes gene_type:complete
MAVNIDTVYQRVQAIANKEQRGYITPQEFNLHANQAQMDIFEQYFYDLEFFLQQPSNDTTYADMVDMLNEKIDIFERYRQSITNLTNAAVGTFPTHYRMGELYFKLNGSFYEIEKIDQNQIHHIQNSPLIAPTETRPCYVQLTELTFQIYPETINDADEANVKCNYIARPAAVNWNYTLVNGYPLYNATNSADFELHASDETELVIKILALAGITLNDPNLYQMAAGEDAKSEQQEKQ